MSETEAQWFFDLSTGEVSQGKSIGFENRMGPYATEAEARGALDRVAARNQAADDWDETEED